MSDLTDFIKDSIEWYLEGLERGHDANHVDSGLVWPSALGGCAKKEALLRAKNEKPVFSFETKLKMLIGSEVGKFVADALTATAEGDQVFLTTEETVKTEYLSGHTDIAINGAVKAIIEVKYATYWYPGFSMRNLLQLVAYMNATDNEQGVLLMIYNTGGIAQFEVAREVHSDTVVYHVKRADGSRVVIKDNPEFITNDFDEVCVPEFLLKELVQDAKFWLDSAAEDYEKMKVVVGPKADKYNIPFVCAHAKEPDFYKSNYKGNKIGDVKPGSGTIRINCPFFSTCYKTEDELIEGELYIYNGTTIGEKTQ